MKKIYILLALCIVFSAACYSQKKTCHDSLITRTIERYINPPDCIDCDYTGISLLKIYREDDSVKIKTIYASGNGYNFDNDKGLSKGLTLKCKNYIGIKDTIVAPVYFYYNNGTLNLPSEKSNSTANKKLRGLGKEMMLLEKIIITSYPAVR